jgi:hypothetical protein
MAWVKFFLPAIGRKGIATFSRLKDIFYWFCGYLGGRQQKGPGRYPTREFFALGDMRKGVVIDGAAAWSFSLIYIDKKPRNHRVPGLVCYSFPQSVIGIGVFCDRFCAKTMRLLKTLERFCLSD